MHADGPTDRPYFAATAADTIFKHSMKPNQLKTTPPPYSGFTLHHILVESGQDIIAEVEEFASAGDRTVCIISAFGSVYDPILFILNTIGRYEIIDINGLLWSSQSNLISSPITVSIAGPGGLVAAGIAVSLPAFSPIHVVLGSFISKNGRSDGVGFIEEMESRQVGQQQDMLLKVETNLVTISNMIKWEDYKRWSNVAAEAATQSPVNFELEWKNKSRIDKQLDDLMERRSKLGFAIAPKIIFVEPGQDIVKKVIAFVLEGVSNVSIISAHGQVSNATLFIRLFPNSTTKYEGIYEIISIRGTLSPSQCNFIDNDHNHQNQNSSPITVSLLGPNDCMVGGEAMKLIAISPMHVIVFKSLSS